MTTIEQSITNASAVSSPKQNTTDGISGLSQQVLRYFLAFLQTDFKKQQAPRRRIQLKTDAGFRTGIPLRKYSTLYNAMWKLASTAPADGLQFRLPPNKYTAPISTILRDLIRQHVDAMPAINIEKIAIETLEYAKSRRAKAVENPERFIENVLLQFVEATSQKVIHPLLSLLEGTFKDQAYSAIESVYDVESDLTDAVTSRVIENLPSAINTLIVNGDVSPMQGVFEEFYRIDGIRGRIKDFFDDFATADSFQEVRDLQQTLRSSEQQSFYLYLCELRFGPNAFPLFYIPATFDYDENKREFVITFDPHLLINKQAIDWILQERKSETIRVPVSPVTDRIVYLNGSRTFVDEMESVLNKLIPSFEFAANINLRNSSLQQQSTPTLKIANTAYFAVFDKSDEALLNDYEELLAAFEQESSAARGLFENIIRGFINENPQSIRNEVDKEWTDMPIPDRLVADAPIPLNEEQRKILQALNNPKCNYISVQGPPGTGKSHTITAIAFDCILKGKNVLVLSDKTEALDVVQDKLESALQRVRPEDDDFPNPILRLGKTGNTYNRLISASAREKIKTHHDAAKLHSNRIEAEAVSIRDKLKGEIEQTIRAYSNIKLQELDELHTIENDIEATIPGYSTVLQNPLRNTNLPKLEAALKSHAEHANASELLLSLLETQLPNASLFDMHVTLSACVIANGLGHLRQYHDIFALFPDLESHHQAPLVQYLAKYEQLRMPVFGYLFRRGALQQLNSQVATSVPCVNPIDLHKRSSQIKQLVETLGLIRDKATKAQILDQFQWIYRLLRDQAEGLEYAKNIWDLVVQYLNTIGREKAAELRYGEGKFLSPSELLDFIVRASRYAVLWHKISDTLKSVPATDYVGTKARIEQLQTAKMTCEIDRRFLEFVTNKSATAKSIGGVIKAKQKFPEEEFHHLPEAFPCIIAGIRDFAEYVPLRQQLFDVVVIDEGSQVSVAQALPAILRAKRVVVFGDAKQFSNVKSVQASNLINSGYLADIEAYFRANVSEAATKLQRLKHFDVKRSILEFFDLISNMNTMLKKHFRGYQELISFSSQQFYDGQLQAIKIRSLPIEEVIRFEVVQGDGTIRESKNTNKSEAEFILSELRRMIDGGDDRSVGIITPFREQLKLLNEVIYRDAYAGRFESDLRLKVMTFDTCQGEERDLIIYSLVADAQHDGLNYIFPVSLQGASDKIEETLKVQRLNVGFSRAKEGILFVLSKPVDQFKGAIARVLMHFKGQLELRSLPEAGDTDPASPMERKVLDWISKTSFYQQNSDSLEVIAQFPIGEYLRQLDPFYQHPAYRCDFLLRLYGPTNTLNVIIEYDGFDFHFENHAKIHNGNWDQYYRPEDLERQLILESYGYRFLRINRFNLGIDPVQTLSKRLFELINSAKKEQQDAATVSRMKDDAGSLVDGSKKHCPKCGQIRELSEFWDSKLKSGNGGYGKNCMACKVPPSPAIIKRRSPRSRRYWRG